MHRVRRMLLPEMGTLQILLSTLPNSVLGMEGTVQGTDGGEVSLSGYKLEIKDQIMQ